MNRFSIPIVCVFSMFLSWSVVGCAGTDPQSPSAPAARALAGPTLLSLSELSIERLRNRHYESKIQIVESLARPCTAGEVSGEQPNAATRYMAAYESEGQRVYTRIDIPAGPQPAQGFPVIVFAHGWVGEEGAPNWHFGCRPESNYANIYGDMVSAWVKAGFVVFVPGYRGHGTVEGRAADGIEDMRAWDNGAYLMPSFYAVDVLNLISGINSGVEDPRNPGSMAPLDAGRIYINGHSQGGDVALTVLAATGEGAADGIQLAGGSIWSGNIADRFTQLATFRPMQETPAAFLSGDGTWTGMAAGETGTINPDFVFGYPPDTIETPHTDEWTWQQGTWSKPSVEAVLESQAKTMYGVLRSQVEDLGVLGWQIAVDEAGRHVIRHDPAIEEPMSEIGGFDVPQYLMEPLNLHFSDHDFYSLPVWNEELCQRISRMGGECHAFEYAGNSHSMEVAAQDWFSPPGSVAGYEYVIARDLKLFTSKDPESIPFP